MKKKLAIVLSFVLMVVLCCVTLIGCTPSNPSDFLKKWSENKNIALTLSETVDGVHKEVEQGEFKDFEGRTTTETTVIFNEKTMMKKVVEITNIKDPKTGKFAKTDTITPKTAIIVELDKNNKYNVYSYNLVWEKESETSDKIILKGKWIAFQLDNKEDDMSGLISQVEELIKDAKDDVKEIIDDFDNKYTKGKGGVYTQKDKNEDGGYETLKVKSGKLVVDMKNSKDETVATGSYDLNDKVVIPSGAKDALTKFLETETGVITKIEAKNDSNVYTIKIADKEYTLNNKVTGYSMLKDAKVGDKVSVWLKKGMFGGRSIKEFFAFV